MTPHTIDREEVMAYVDGELDAARLVAVQAHVDACDECRAFASELRQVSDRLSSWRIADESNGLARVKQALSSAIAGRPPASSWWMGRGLFNLPRWAVGGGLAVLAGTLVVAPWVLSQRQAPVVQTISMATAQNEGTIPGDSRPGESTTPRSRHLLARSLEAPPAPSPPPPPPPPSPPGQGQGRQERIAPAQPRDRMIVRTASMSLTSDRFDQIREALERLVAAHQGRVTALNMTGDPSSRRSLHATLGVPAARMDALLVGLRGLGRVQQESLGSDDVTESFRDLTLRTTNARREEQRLVELLSRRTGDLADVLAVERELARVRLDIERMEAEMRATEQRVDLATVTLTVQEQYRADLAIGPLPLNLRFKNALVDGFRHAAESLVAASLIVLQAAPMLLVWSLILVWPVRWIWRRVRAVVIQT